MIVGRDRLVRVFVGTNTKQIEKIKRQVTEAERIGRGSATAERLAKALDEDSGAGHEVSPAGRQRLLDAPLDRLHKDGRITSREFEAGDRLRALAYLAAIDPGTMAVDWSMIGSRCRSSKVPTMFSTQHVADARIEYRRIEKALPSLVWTVLFLCVVKEHSLVEIGRAVMGEKNTEHSRAAARAALQVSLATLQNVLG